MTGDALWTSPYSRPVERHSRSETAVGALLVHVWQTDRDALRQRSPARKAFRHLLSALVGRQLPVAFVLADRVRRSGW